MSAARRHESGEFYDCIQEGLVRADTRNVQRQTYVNMLLNKQFCYYNVAAWLDDDPAHPEDLPAARRNTTGTGHELSLHQMTTALAKRLAGLLLRGPGGRRSAFAQSELLQTDPYSRDYLLFHEYFDGDNDKGFGASHQTSWTGLVVRLLQQA